MGRCAAAILYVEILAVTLLSQTSSRPVPAEVDSRQQRSPSMQTPPVADNFFGVPGLVITTVRPAVKVCKIVQEVKRNQTVWTLSAKGTLQSSLQEVTQYVTTCCVGWNGTECDVAPPTTPPPRTTAHVALDPSSPCANLTCAGVGDAVCAVVTKCGRQIPLFIDSTGQLVDCPNSPTNIDEILCTGSCRDDPCARNVSCPKYPEAMCFTSECDCKALWLLPSGVEVNCLSVDKRETGTASSANSECPH